MMFFSFLVSAFTQLLLFLIIPFVWWSVTDRKISFTQWIGLKRPSFTDSKWKIFGAVLAVAVLYIAAMYAIVNTLLQGVMTAASQFEGKGWSVLPAVVIYALIQTSLSEELFFRGFLCKRLINQFGFVPGNLIQSVLFGLCHGIPFGIATNQWAVCVLLTLLPGAVGYLQGWLNEKKAGGSILPNWILHGLMNLLSALISI